MAKVKNIKGKKSSINWTRIWYYVKSLFNNEICKEIGVKHWIISIFVFLISITLTIIPTSITESTRKGSSSVNNSNNDILAAGLHYYALNDDSDLKMEEHKLLKIDGDSKQEISSITSGSQKLGIYYLDTSLSTNGTFSEQRSIILDSVNYSGFIFFGTDYFSVSVYKDTTKSTLICSATGSYKSFEDFTSLKSYLLKDVDKTAYVNDQKTQIMNNFYTFCDTAYLDARMQTTLLQVGMLAGINAGITIIMTLVLFLMSRGKQNPNSLLKFQEVMGITFFASLTPALLSMIIGFLMGGSFQTVCMLYIMTFGFRCMWLSMKYLRPQYQQ